jgi:hypothetical protein
LVFGALAVVYIGYWSRRAISATSEASALFKQTGSIAETARRLYAHEKMPDAYRLSANQRQYVDRHFDEFMEIYRDTIFGWHQHFAAEARAKRDADQITEAELDTAETQILALVVFRFSKEWCEIRGVA